VEAIGEIIIYLFAQLFGWAIGKIARPHASATAQRDFGCLVLFVLAVAVCLAVSLLLYVGTS